MFALQTEEGEPGPQHSLASAQINDPSCCSLSIAATMGLPVSRGCPCVSGSPPPGSLPKSTLTWAIIYCSGWVTSPSNWIQTGLLRTDPWQPLGASPFRPGFPLRWAPKSWVPPTSHSHMGLEMEPEGLVFGTS